VDPLRFLDMPILACLTLVEGAIHDITVTFGQQLVPNSCGMTKPVSYKRHRFPSQIIAHAGGCVANLEQERKDGR